MAVNSSLGASFLTARNDNFLALANLAADFSLVKIEVPRQFEGLGNALSVQRRENAERGSQHRAARRLGLLFEQLIPDIKDLAAAYGTRASEIARSSKLETMSKDCGPFSEHVGIDGTSIYAAASSGPTVIALHLLACMLARLFSSAEATAIWVQLVECRLREIQQQADASQLQGLAALYAAEHGRQILRTDLAEWDASARAWLETADQVKRREHTQLKLIIQNIPSIQHSAKTYANVIENWVFAMKTAQKSIQGVPQDVSSGSILLGFMAWHIYPDLNVFNPNRYVEFQDPLVRPGGVITLGLEQKDKSVGVTWSMSLSHFRFYGEPVIIEKSSGEDGDRLTARELELVTFGCVLSSWSNPSSVNILEAAAAFSALESCLDLGGDLGDQLSSFQSSLGWLEPLFKAARCLLNAPTDKDVDNALYLVEFGRRKGRNFLDVDFMDIIPMFGLVNDFLLNTLCTYKETESTEDSIRHLRELARKCKFNQADCIILSRPRIQGRDGEPMKVGGISCWGNWEVASAVPCELIAEKRDSEGQIRTHATTQHVRWIHTDRTTDIQMQRLLEKQLRDINPASQEECDPSFSEQFTDPDMPLREAPPSLVDEKECNCANMGSSCDDTCYCVKMGYSCTSACSCVALFMGSEESILCSNVRPRRAEANPRDEGCRWLSVRSIRNISELTSINSVAKFEWFDPPAYFLERYMARGQQASQGANSIPEQFPMNYQENAWSDPWEQDSSELFSDWLNFDGEEDTTTTPRPAKHQAFMELYRQNAIRHVVTFYPMAANRGGASILFTDRAETTMPRLALRELTAILKSGKIDRELLMKYLSKVPREGILDYSTTIRATPVFSKLFFTSLRAMGAVSELYDEWPEATISISVTKKALGLALWVKALPQHFTVDVYSKSTPGRRITPGQMVSAQGGDSHITTRRYRSIKFSCLAMMESGVHSIHPDQLEHVMAMAAGNSIYAAELLVQDPFLQDRSGQPWFRGIRRILGSLGCPGIVMLVPPVAPLLKQIDPERFRDNLSGQAQLFDGDLVRDSFGDTSLHLKFTEYKIPLATAPGAIDADIVLREALISVFDGSRWVADLDLLQTLSNPAFLSRFSSAGAGVMGGNQNHKHQHCSHRGQDDDAKTSNSDTTTTTKPQQQQDRPAPLGHALVQAMGDQIKSIGSWDGLIGCRENLLRDEVGVVRAHGNWYSRLAAASLGVRLGCHVAVFPLSSRDTCPSCSKRMVSDARSSPAWSNRQQLFIL